MSYDFSPLFRTAIGFDRMARLIDSAQDVASAQTYPPYNIAKLSEDSYRLTVAVAGFSESDLELVVRDNQLLVSGKVNPATLGGELLHRGIAGRGFERRFALADHLVVEGASLQNGLLHVALKRVVPEALKPRRIEIAAAAPQQQALANDQAPAAHEAQAA